MCMITVFNYTHRFRDTCDWHGEFSYISSSIILTDTSVMWCECDCHLCSEIRVHDKKPLMVNNSNPDRTHWLVSMWFTLPLSQFVSRPFPLAIFSDLLYPSLHTYCKLSKSAPHLPCQLNEDKSLVTEDMNWRRCYQQFLLIFITLWYSWLLAIKI